LFGEKELTDEFVGCLMETERDTAIWYTGSLVDKMALLSEGKDFDENQYYMICLCEGMSHFFKSQEALTDKDELVLAINHLGECIKCLERISLGYFIYYAKGLEIYYSGILDIRLNNLKQGIKKLEEAKGRLEDVDVYGETFLLKGGMIEAEIFYSTGVSCISEYDYENALIAFNKASSVTRYLSNKYYNKDAYLYNFTKGLSYYYLGYAHFMVQIRRMSELNFDFFEYTENDTKIEINKSIACLSKCLENLVARKIISLSKGIKILSVVLQEVGQRMSKLLLGNNSKEDYSLTSKELNKALSNSSKFFAEVGDTSITHIRFCKKVENMILQTDKFFYKNNIIQNSSENTSNETLKIVNDLIAKGNNGKAIDYIISNSADYDVFNHAILLKARHERLKSKSIKGIIGETEKTLFQNQLSNSIIDLLRLIRN